MNPEEKVEVTETDDSNTSAIHPFDRYMSSVYARKNEDDQSSSPKLAHQTPAQPEPRKTSDNSAGEALSGSEKLRIEIIARAREADSRAQAAEERVKQVESRLKQEQALRLLADQRVSEVESEYKQRLSSAQGADFSRLELELALAESEAKLKQEAEARWLADTILARTRDEARAVANSAAQASEEAEKRIIELEGELESLQNEVHEQIEALKSTTLAWNEAEKRIAELENALTVSSRDNADKALVVEAASRELAPRVQEAETRALSAESNLQATEARLQYEIERRAAAEQKVHALEIEFKSDLEMDWARFEADIEKAEAAVKAREESIAKSSAELARREYQDLIQHLSTQLETEQRARIEIEKKLIESESRSEKVKGQINAAPERKMAEMESALKAANIARAEAERRLVELERTRIASYSQSGANSPAHSGANLPAHSGAHTPAHSGSHTAAVSGAHITAGHRVTGTEQKPHRGEVKQRASEMAPRNSQRGGVKAEPAKTAPKSARKIGKSSLLTLGLSAEPSSPAPAPDPSRKEEIKLVGIVAAISLLLLVLIVLGLSAYRLL